MSYRALQVSWLVSLLAFAQAPGAGNVAGDGNWPREIQAGNIHLVIYQPQVDSWKDNRIEARSAVIVTRKEDPITPPNHSTRCSQPILTRCAVPVGYAKLDRPKYLHELQNKFER